MDSEEESKSGEEESKSGDDDDERRSSHSETSSSEDEQRRSLDCRICGKPFKKPKLLRQHLRCHSSERPFICPDDTCTSTYKRKDHLDRHIRQKHDSERNLQECSWPGCMYTCTSRSNFQRHMKLHEKKGTLQRHRDRSSEEPKKHICSMGDCKRAFRYRSQLKYHQETCHDQLYMDIVCGEPGCNERFDTPGDLAEHTRNAHKYVFCEICGKVCPRKSIKSHYQSHEAAGPAKERIVCPYAGCMHTYWKECNLRKHIKVAHLGLTPYQCSQPGCGKTFAYKHVKDRHELVVHTPGDFAVELEQKKVHKGGRKRKVTVETVHDIFTKRVQRKAGTET